MKKIAIIGTGYVGLTTGAYLAHLGHQVCCGDISAEKIQLLNQGKLPIFEPGLEKIVKEELSTKRLSFVVGATNAIKEAEFIFLCLPTPTKEDGSVDMSFIEAVCKEIGPALESEAVVINKSTVPIGSTKKIEEIINRSDISVVSNPEFLREGSAIYDSLNPDRIVIGSQDPEVAMRVASLYKSIHTALVITSPASAELIKYASNAFLATKISFVNSIANLCESAGADIKEVTLGMGYDRRIGFEFLKPGPGWGGSCFPKDTKALISIADKLDYDFELLKQAVKTNDLQYEKIVQKILNNSNVSTKDSPPKIAVWGLTFKAQTDDLRDSPSLNIINMLISKGAEVHSFDPQISFIPASHLLPVSLIVSDDPYEICKEASVLAILTEWDEFRRYDFEKVRDFLESPQIIDARNLLDPIVLRKIGFKYEGVGLL